MAHGLNIKAKFLKLNKTIFQLGSEQISVYEIKRIISFSLLCS